MNVLGDLCLLMRKGEKNQRRPAPGIYRENLNWPCKMKQDSHGKD